MGLLDFENRLKKRFKHKAKWAKNNDVSCFRIYDKDLPDFPFVIDKFEDYLIMSIDVIKNGKETNAYWLNDVKQSVAQILQINPTHISIKLRFAQKGNFQYAKLNDSGSLISVKESGLNFLINPFDYLDTGLFLDHRITRQWVRKDSLNKRVLNLFAYTGSFSVYAAAGKALHVTTVDMSNTYLQWAKKNMFLNGFTDPKKYTYLREDILTWISAASPASFDLIILDPPTFSNSKKMQRTWEIQRDHSELINRIQKLLSPGGILYFSGNYQKFKLNITEIIGFETVEDLTQTSVPADFEKTKPHYCFKFRNKWE
jgi:23S rRNA (cytosine1962-C5)-methyltransferase